jgi:hypothetical protein
VISRDPAKAAQIPDMSSWEATARIGELDRRHISEGQLADLTVVPYRVKACTGRSGRLAAPQAPWDIISIAAA